MSTPTTHIDGLVIKVMSNGKVDAKQVVVVALIFPKITYTWPYLILLTSVIGPLVAEPFNWFIVSSWHKYMQQQKSLKSLPRSYFITPTNATLQLSEYLWEESQSPYKANILQWFKVYEE
ncbi:hypothetical protein Lalb_Chr17g0347391 [Lupinus albus]|uniref:Uncharacterized protein n=1 Tax=Lupinus albus TaxID=3870 RepID=A0A6A4NRB5_LUPAL|nr:hypothetical protein Lalb_Chr17g0347391 [Lupinus albus]